MKLRSFYYILTSIVLALLLVAAVSFYWLLSQSPLSLLKGSQEATPRAAIFVSRQAPAMVSLLVNPDQLADFRLVAVRPGERRQARAELNQLKQSLLANTGFSYEQDIRPWLGNELTLAVTTLDIDRDLANGKQPGYLLAIATQNPERSREFLQLFWQKRALAGADLVFEQYKGVKIIHASPLAESAGSKTGGRGPKTGGKVQNSTSTSPFQLPTSALSSAAVGDRFILFANHPKVLRDAINNVQAPDLSLSNASFYQQSLQTLTEPRVGLTFVNLPNLATWLGESATQSPAISSKQDGSPSTASSGEPSFSYQTLAVAFKLDRQGVLADTALIAKEGKAATVSPSLSEPVSALQYIPANSSFAASGTNLNRVWTGLSQDLQSYGTLSKLVNQPLLDLQKQWNIDFPKDIFDWVKGEYALGLVSEDVRGEEKGGKNQGAQPKDRDSSSEDWVFVAQRDSDAAKQGIARLDAIAQKQGLSVGPVKLGNQTIFTWTKLTTGSGKQDTLALRAEVQGVHAAIGNYEIFTTSIAAIDRVLKTVDRSLLKDNRFQQAINPLLQPNNGYLYLDWATSQPLLEQQFPLLKVIKLAGKPLLNHFQSLTVSGYGNQSGVQRSGVFIKLS
ncbi:MAG: DUF3352 domain-containing protein [Kovacikia sp.]